MVSNDTVLQIEMLLVYYTLPINKYNFIPLILGGQTKEIYLDVSDRGEIPVVSDGYCISLAYVSLLDCVRSLSLLIDQPENSQVNEGTVEPIDQKCIQTLLESSWCGLLSAMSLLLDASTDDASTENILKHLETYASFCGKINLTGPRDAYLAAICKASLPPHYTLNVLKATPSTQVKLLHTNIFSRC